MRNRQRRHPLTPLSPTRSTALSCNSDLTGPVGLTRFQHAVVGLAYFGGHSYVEVAAALGVEPSTVKTQIREALRALGQSGRHPR